MLLQLHQTGMLEGMEDTLLLQQLEETLYLLEDNLQLEGILELDMEGKQAAVEDIQWTVVGTLVVEGTLHPEEIVEGG